MADTNKDNFGLAASWQALAYNLIQAIAANTIHLEEPSSQSFRQGLMETLELLQNNPSSATVLATAAGVLTKIEDYQRDTQQSIDRLIAELRGIIGMLLSNMAEVQVESAGADADLARIQERLLETQTEEQFAAVKADLNLAINRVREQASTRKQTTADQVASLEERLHVREHFQGASTIRFSAASADSSQSAPEGLNTPASVVFETIRRKSPETESTPSRSLMDAGTGLPNQSAFTETMLHMPSPRAGLYLAVFFIQGMENINARYGDSVGDDLLLFCVQLLASQVLQPAERLFRWRGPLFCALLERKNSLRNIRKDVCSRIGPRVQFMRRNGSLLLNVEVTSDVVSAETANLEELLQYIENFALLPSNRA